MVNTNVSETSTASGTAAMAFSATRSLTLPKYCYARGSRIWTRTKENGKWVNRKTEYTTDSPVHIELARQHVEILRQGAASRAVANTNETFPLARTLGAYIAHWLAEREERGLASAIDDRNRLVKYVIPYLGNMLLEEVRPRHVRDLVRHLMKLRRAGEIAPRTVIHIYRALHNVYESARVDEVVLTNPVHVESGELPKKVDADPEWRMLACYEPGEVETLLTSVNVPMHRRVMYALKALAGLRHGEAAALCWRHYDAALQPLGRLRVVQAYASREDIVKSTKTEETRAVPVHPALAAMLAAWRARWADVYGREPAPDDFVVPDLEDPTRCVHVLDAGATMRADLDLLGLRVMAGSRRARGGHDLRAWFLTQTITDGGDSLVVRRTTHAAPKDVNGGYERFAWATLCREVGKLKIGVGAP